MALVLVVGGAFVGFRLLFGGASKDELIEQADEICRQKLDQAAAIETPTDLESTGNLFEEVTPILESQTREIKALDAPEEDADVLAEWLNTQEQLVGIFRAAADAARSDDQEGFDEAFAEANAIQARSSELAAEYGFDVCGISTPS